MMKKLHSGFVISSALCLGAMGLSLPATHAFAQSPGALATSPYLPQIGPDKAVSGAPVTASIGPNQPLPKAVALQTDAGSHRLPVPIVVFQGRPASPITLPAAADIIPLHAIPSPAEISQLQNASSAPVPLPLAQTVTAPQKEASPKPPSAFRRIWRDTRKSVVHDVPEALADALPWVDRPRKDEPLDDVLARVSSDLARASAHDPEWVGPAETELRQLSKRLSTLAEPTPISMTPETARQPVSAPVEVRPFRPRPIWPGASGRPEPQSRPVAVATGTEVQPGPQAQGRRLPPPTDWVEDEPAAEKSPSPRVVPKRPRRPSR
ncbi:hypothetical protein PbB2_00792 [Candidatus Phycosocius bacilliformis]|uniref:Secreted protein n=1 Tax=Candidatus Phycosocius bacilliformis TaxID=1445552 RepID=A0A2P2E7T4_9PROT|nr:hypothetical protein [Candidatus Phycosocius bacilliformis]GBF57132.1 hypothetical protein PbB2_00792 [Candidatus Phycosocius bacilliformis]